MRVRVSQSTELIPEQQRGWRFAYRDDAKEPLCQVFSSNGPRTTSDMRYADASQNIINTRISVNCSTVRIYVSITLS
jgi:hypothetical protein